MRLALSTTAFARTLAAGELTQLELLDVCAGELRCDGVVLDIAHFPRRDPEYVAQVKKFSADLALTIVAVRDDALTVTAQAAEALILASHLGAPYVLTRMPESGTDPVLRYNEALAHLARAVAEAKRLNVTLAVRNVPGSLASDGFELGRLRKEADSAWLCFALDPGALRAAPDERLRRHLVLAYAAGEDPEAEVVLRNLAPFTGFLCLDLVERGTAPELDAVRSLVRHWRRSACAVYVPD